MKKGILLTSLILLMAVVINAQERWVEKTSEDGQEIEKEIMMMGGPGGYPGMPGNCGGQHGFMGKGRRGGQHDCFYGFGEEPGPDKGHGIGMILRFADELELTEAQINKIKDMQFKFKLEQIDREAALEKARMTLKKMKMDDAPENDVFAAIDKKAALKTEIAKKIYQHHQAMKNILTDKQKEKIKELHRFKGVQKGEFKGMRRMEKG